MSETRNPVVCYLLVNVNNPDLIETPQKITLAIPPGAKTVRVTGTSSRSPNHLFLVCDNLPNINTQIVSVRVDHLSTGAQEILREKNPLIGTYLDEGEVVKTVPIKAFAVLPAGSKIQSTNVGYCPEIKMLFSKKILAFGQASKTAMKRYAQRFRLHPGVAAILQGLMARARVATKTHAERKLYEYDHQLMRKLYKIISTQGGMTKPQYHMDEAKEWYAMKLPPGWSSLLRHVHGGEAEDEERKFPKIEVETIAELVKAFGTFLNPEELTFTIFMSHKAIDQDSPEPDVQSFTRDHGYPTSQNVVQMVFCF